MERVSSGIFFVPDNVEREAFGHFFENALRLLGLLEQVRNLRKRRNLHPQLLAEQHRQLIDQAEVTGIGQRDFEGSVIGLNRHEIVTEHQVDRDGVEQIVVDL